TFFTPYLISGRRLDRPVVHGLIVRHHGLQAEAFDRPSPRRFRVGAAEQWVFQVLAKHLRQRCDITRLEQPAVVSILDQLHVPAPGGGQYWQATGHGLEDRVGDSLRQRREYEDVEETQNVRNITERSRKPGQVGDI